MEGKEKVVEGWANVLDMTTFENLKAHKADSLFCVIMAAGDRHAHAF